MATVTTPSSYEEQWVPRSFKGRGSIISGTACTFHGPRGGRSCRLTTELQRGISHPLLGSVSRWMILQQKGGALTPLIAGKEVPMVNRNSLISEPSIVVIDDPPFLTTTQVQNIPHPGSRGPMTGTKELKSRCEDPKDNSSCMFLFICVSKNKMLDSRFKNWANLFNCLVNSMEDHTWMIVVLAKQIGWMLSLCKSVLEDMYLQRLEIVTPTWLRIGWTYVGLTLSLLSPTWSCLLDLRR